MSENNASAHTEMNTEIRYLVIYGYTSRELAKVIKHFKLHLPEYVKMTVRTQSLVSRITLTGVDNKVELLRFNMNRFQQMLADIFSEEVISMQDKTLPQVLGELLTERELSVSCAESCTGGNIAHRIVQIPGSSAYFMGSNKCDLAASLQRTIVDILIDKFGKAIDAHPEVQNIAVAGGVSANSAVRKAVAELGQRKCCTAWIPPRKFTTDNAAMVAIAGYYKYLRQDFCPLDAPPFARVNI